MKIKTFDVVIFDLDGTLTLTEQRHHLVPPKNTADSDEAWNAFSLASKDDPPNPHVVLLARRMYYLCNDLILFSGRGEIARMDTVKWLMNNDILYDELVLRPIGDPTPDDILKHKWYRDRNLSNRDTLVFEDRNRVVKMWRGLGVDCFQVANGDF